MNEIEKARYRLAELMLSNLYFIPKLLERDIQPYDMWHSSSDGNFDYFDYLPPEIYGEISINEKGWISKLYDSPEFEKIRHRQVLWQWFITNCNMNLAYHTTIWSN